MDLFSEILATRHTETAPAARLKMANLATAVVKENWNEELPGYVKVEYVLGEEGEKNSDWLRVLHGYAGNGYGSYALPEIGSEVLVGFVMGDLDNGVVLGCLHGTSNKLPTETADKENSKKQFRTKGGHQICFYEEKGKEKIEIKTPGQLTVTLEDENKKIEIRDDTGKNMVAIDGKNGGLTLKAEKTLELVCGSAKISLDGSKNKVSASAGSVSLQGNQALELSGQSLKAEGTTTEIKAKGTMKVEASGITEIKGAMLKLN